NLNRLRCSVRLGRLPLAAVPNDEASSMGLAIAIVLDGDGDGDGGITPCGVTSRKMGWRRRGPRPVASSPDPTKQTNHRITLQSQGNSMNTNTQTPPFIFEVPEPPEEFGQDGGKFYKAYDAIAEEMDDDMTKSLKEQLDGMLIFVSWRHSAHDALSLTAYPLVKQAGLFAGVNSAFLAITLPLMLADPADDTNALLAQNNAILIQLVSGRNDSALLETTLPSKSFAPSGAVLSVNVLFALSLAFAIIASFLAVLGRQWLVYYRKRSGGGPDGQRWEQLKRFLGAERWGLELILDDILPSLLQTDYKHRLVMVLPNTKGDLFVKCGWALEAPTIEGHPIFAHRLITLDEMCTSPNQ
ncbi:hypothetical protein FRC01_009048, partial [Tulasnella sp. 417]